MLLSSSSFAVYSMSTIHTFLSGLAWGVVQRPCQPMFSVFAPVFSFYKKILQAENLFFGTFVKDNEVLRENAYYAKSCGFENGAKNRKKPQKKYTKDGLMNSLHVRCGYFLHAWEKRRNGKWYSIIYRRK